MQRDGPFSMSLYQSSNGMIRTAHFDSSVSPPSFTHNDIEQEPAPIGFVFVKESYGARLPGHTVFGYNANSRAKAIDIADSMPLLPTVRDLGAIDNTGTQFNFQGGTALSNPNGIGNYSEILTQWNKFYSYREDSQQIDIDNDYPLEGVGGPVAACRRIHNDFISEIYIAGPRVGSAGTDLHVKLLDSPDVIFNDGFESGNTSAWASCP